MFPVGRLYVCYSNWVVVAPMHFFQDDPGVLSRKRVSDQCQVNMRGGLIVGSVECWLVFIQDSKILVSMTDWIVIPLASRLPSYHIGLWAFMSPTIIVGLGS